MWTKYILYKEARNTMQALIKDKKRKLLQEKLSENNENIGKPKELWKFIKKLGYQTRRLSYAWRFLSFFKSWRFLPRQVQILFKNILWIFQVIFLRNFLTLLENLKYLQCVSITRKLFSVKKKLIFENVTLASILRILKEFKTNKATEVENIMRRFLKDSSNILCTPIAKICNLSIILALSQINIKSQR